MTIGRYQNGYSINLKMIQSVNNKIVMMTRRLSIETCSRFMTIFYLNISSIYALKYVPTISGINIVCQQTNKLRSHIFRMDDIAWAAGGRQRVRIIMRGMLLPPRLPPPPPPSDTIEPPLTILKQTDTAICLFNLHSPNHPQHPARASAAERHACCCDWRPNGME